MSILALLENLNAAACIDIAAAVLQVMARK